MEEWVGLQGARNRPCLVIEWEPCMGVYNGGRGYGGAAGLLPYQGWTKIAGDFSLVSLCGGWEKMEMPSCWEDKEEEDKEAEEEEEEEEEKKYKKGKRRRE
ncbi:hypothetical protein E2C01_057374 [Portunus trituberculatus]|uniref:Uncharacterized protein n=1 Tax=Portunus trituberculatus TaxID=210409 RepID=A0A5B7H276_PORTR|nr:hypothetical protein [Portunus trituberculatus]